VGPDDRVARCDNCWFRPSGDGNVSGLHRPSVAAMKQRLQVVANDRTLGTPAPGAHLTQQESVLCADSSSPHYVWRYRYDGLFRSVVDFYSDVLAAIAGPAATPP